MKNYIFSLFLLSVGCGIYEKKIWSNGYMIFLYVLLSFHGTKICLIRQSINVHTYIYMYVRRFTAYSNYTHFKRKKNHSLKWASKQRQGQIIFTAHPLPLPKHKNLEWNLFTCLHKRQRRWIAGWRRGNAANGLTRVAGPKWRRCGFPSLFPKSPTNREILATVCIPVRSRDA